MVKGTKGGVAGKAVGVKWKKAVVWLEEWCFLATTTVVFLQVMCTQHLVPKSCLENVAAK